MKNALNNQVGMLGDMFLWLVANLKQGVIYFIEQALPPNISAGSVNVRDSKRSCDSSGCQLIFLRIPPMIFLGIQECKVLLYTLWEVIAKIATE